MNTTAWLAFLGRGCLVLAFYFVLLYREFAGDGFWRRSGNCVGPISGWLYRISYRCRSFKVDLPHCRRFQSIEACILYLSLQMTVDVLMYSGQSLCRIEILFFDKRCETAQQLPAGEPTVIFQPRCWVFSIHFFSVYVRIRASLHNSRDVFCVGASRCCCCFRFVLRELFSHIFWEKELKSETHNVTINNPDNDLLTEQQWVPHGTSIFSQVLTVSKQFSARYACRNTHLW